MRTALVILVALASVARAEESNCSAKRKRVAALKDVLASAWDATPEYRAIMAKKIVDAEEDANACDRRLADEKRAAEAQLLAQRKAEVEAAQKQAAETAAIEEMKTRPETIRLVWSAYVCAYEKDRDAVINNPFATPEQRETVSRADAMIANAKAIMKRGKLLQISCRITDVAKLAFCLADAKANPACSSPSMALLLRAQSEIIASGQVVANRLALTPRGAPPSTMAAKQRTDDDMDMDILKPKF